MLKFIMVQYLRPTVDLFSISHKIIFRPWTLKVIVKISSSVRLAKEKRILFVNKWVSLWRTEGQVGLNTRVQWIGPMFDQIYKDLL